MDRVAVVLLNYLNYKDTIECVKSIENDIYDNKFIVIVDNNSNNESWEVLNRLYGLNNKIKLIKSDKNLGFAKGNNLGIEYSRRKLGCKFILLANNDTIFNDSMLITEMINAYEEGVGAIGPRIITNENVQQNPIMLNIEKEFIERQIKEYKNIIIKLKKTKVWQAIRNSKIIRKIKNKDEEYLNLQTNTLSENSISSKDLVLHGACILLTPDYFKYYKCLYPKTFLYHEECILTLIMKKVGLKSKYISSVSISHKEDKSSYMSFKNKINIKEKYLLSSAKVCLRVFDLSYEEILKDF